jgi:DNA-binding LacI/PurR family transcriptional regulator
MRERSGPPTIVDVAEAAGVSRTQASDALNGRGRVDLTTRRRVMDAATRLGYRVNVSARSLRSGKTGILALLLPAMEGAGEDSEALGLDYYMRLTSAAAAAAFAGGYAVVLVPPLDGPAQLQEIPFDGAILSDPDEGDERLKLLDARGAVVVTIERDIARHDRFYVGSDTTHNTRAVLDHLAEAGAARIALLSPDARWAWIVETADAYRSWCQEQRRDEVIVSVPLRRLEGSSYEACRRLLSGPNPPDAVVALADRYALGALRAASDLGIEVPDELLVAAGVDSHASAEIQPGITALDLHPERSAAAAVAMLASRLAGERVQAPHLVNGELIVRRSTQR